MHDILILGGGFAGLWAAIMARRTAVDEQQDISITLVSRDDQLTLRPRLYEPDPQRFRVPMLPILSAIDVDFIEAEVTSIDTNESHLTVADNDDRVAYKRMIFAAGSVLNTSNIPDVEKTFNLDSWSAAMAFDSHLKNAMPNLDSPVIAIIGAGFTGIEIAMELRGRIASASSNATAEAARIILLDNAEMVGKELGDNPRPVIEAALDEARIERRLGVEIAAIDDDGLTLATGEHITADVVITASGAVASPLAGQLGVPRDNFGRVTVERDLRVTRLGNIFAAGDVAKAEVDDAGNIAMMSCQHAMTMGKFAGHNAVRDLIGLPTIPYTQERYTTCLDLGSAGAVFTIGWDRVVEKTGAEAKQRKQLINGEIIYPPRGDRDQILAAATLVR